MDASICQGPPNTPAQHALMLRPVLTLPHQAARSLGPSAQHVQSPHAASGRLTAARHAPQPAWGVQTKTASMPCLKQLHRSTHSLTARHQKVRSLLRPLCSLWPPDSRTLPSPTWSMRNCEYTTSSVMKCCAKRCGWTPVSC